MKRQTGVGINEQLEVTGGSGPGGGSVDQGTGGSSPWLITIDPADLPLPVLASIDTTGLATDANQVTGNASLSSIDSKLTSPLSVTGPLTDSELRASPVPVSSTNLDIRDLAFASDKADVSGSSVSLAAGTAAIGKLTPSTPVLQSALSTTVQTVVGSAGVLTSYYIYNPNVTVAYVQIFDISGTVTLGSSTPKWSIGIPPMQAANLAGLRLTFANAIKVAATTTATGSAALTTAVDANFGYE